MNYLHESYGVITLMAMCPIVLVWVILSKLGHQKTGERYD